MSLVEPVFYVKPVFYVVKVKTWERQSKDAHSKFYLGKRLHLLTGGMILLIQRDTVKNKIDFFMVSKLYFGGEGLIYLKKIWSHVVRQNTGSTVSITILILR